MPAYWIAHVTVKDPQKYQHYMDLAPQAFRQYNARFLARGEQAQTLEGPAFVKHVLIEFDNYTTALACYHSPAYQLAKQQRRHVAEAMITIVDGLPLTQ
ncbi:DUF1330 domain-containing protein [Serratia marcescens]|uniref:DUF1330 domain-containing protein n=1 Tax=Serratia marcescens TaxID=615 RepID=UPI000D7318F0|nr:DUF1330 domain-containing protein [Serratia marcescens]AWQ47893.1 hypothetical protein B1A42_11350 [Serratia marcescens]